MSERDLMVSAMRFERRAREAERPERTRAEPTLADFPEDLLRLLAREDLLAPALSTRWAGLSSGGRGGALIEALTLLRAVGRADLSLGRLYEGHLNALQLVGLFGGEGQRARALADAEAGRLFGVWNTEGPDPVRLVPLGPDLFRLQGAKTFASGAGRVDRPLITAALPDGGRQLVLLEGEAGADRVQTGFWRPIGMEASCSFRIDLTGLEVDAGALVGAPGDYQAQPWFGAGAIRFAAVQLGGAEALVEIARAHLRRTRRAADPYQTLRISEMAIALESGALWLQAAAERLDGFDAQAGQDEVERIVAYAAMARSAIERVCLDVLERTVRSVGVSGLVAPHPLGDRVRDLTLYLRQPAPDAVLVSVGRYALDCERPLSGLWCGPAGKGDD